MTDNIETDHHKFTQHSSFLVCWHSLFKTFDGGVVIPFYFGKPGKLTLFGSTNPFHVKQRSVPSPPLPSPPPPCFWWTQRELLKTGAPKKLCHGSTSWSRFRPKNSRDYEAYYLPFATKLRGNFVRREHYCPQSPSFALIGADVARATWWVLKLWRCFWCVLCFFRSLVVLR